MRTRFIVAIAALMAASALVAVPEPAGSSAPSSARQIDWRPCTPSRFRRPPVPRRWRFPSSTRRPARPDGSGPVRRSSNPARAGSRPARISSTSQTPAPACTTRTTGGSTATSAGTARVLRIGTACGQKYTKTMMGVAHRTLPCGTLVTFRNPANGRQITVPVIDRGPYVAGRQWDMSRGAVRLPRPLLHGIDRMALGRSLIRPLPDPATRSSRAGPRGAPSACPPRPRTRPRTPGCSRVGR